MFSLLRDSRLRIIWLAECVSAFGSGLTLIALAWFLYQLYPDAPQVSALVLGTWTTGLLLGAVVFSPFVDLWDRRATLRVSNLLLGMWISLIPLLHVTNALSLAAFVIVAALLGLSGSVLVPAQQAGLPTLIEARDLQQAQALFGLIRTTAGLVAPLTAGVLIALIGAPAVLWIDAVTYGVAFVAYSIVRFPPALRRLTRRPSLQSWWADTRSGVRFLMSCPPLLVTLLCLASVNFTIEPYVAVLLPRLADRLAHTSSFVPSGAIVVGVLGSTVAVAQLMAVMWAGRTTFRSPLNVIIASALLAAACVFLMMFTSHLALAVIVVALAGVALGLLVVLTPTLFARLTPPELHGRVFGVRFLIGQGLRPVGLGMAGAFVGAFGVTVAGALVSGAALVLCAFGAARLSATHPRQLERELVQHEP